MYKRDIHVFKSVKTVPDISPDKKMKNHRLIKGIPFCRFTLLINEKMSLKKVTFR